MYIIVKVKYLEFEFVIVTLLRISQTLEIWNHLSETLSSTKSVEILVTGKIIPSEIRTKLLSIWFRLIFGLVRNYYRREDLGLLWEIILWRKEAWIFLGIRWFVRFLNQLSFNDVTVELWLVLEKEDNLRQISKEEEQFIVCVLLEKKKMGGNIYFRV